MSDFDLGYRDPLWNKMDQALKEIERLKSVIADHAVAHEEVLLKHTREQGAALDTIENAINRIVQLKALCARAADALRVDYTLDHLQEGLINELREAAK